MSSGKRTGLLFGGIIVIVIFFFGGFFSIFWVDDWNVGSILFRMMVLPMVGFLIGSAMIVYATQGGAGTRRRMGIGLFGMMRPTESSKEKTYVHDIPDKCPNCQGQISNETVDWVGPLTARCPYCGSSIKTEKREV
jgi:Na+(H+)/acetate symporter ActP